MKTLQIFETLPYPPDAGAKIKAYYTLKHLAELGPVDLICFARDESQLAFRPELEEICRRVEIIHKPRNFVHEFRYLATSFLKRQPYTVLRHYDKPTAQKVAKMWQEGDYDLLYLNHLSTAKYMQPGATAILDTHNAHYVLMERYAESCSAGPARWLASLEASHLRRFEAKAMAETKNILAVSQCDADHLQKICQDDEDIKIHVVPIGVDLATRPYLGPSKGSHRILFLGALHWPPNADAALWMARDILPLVRKKVPDAELWLVGMNPPDKVKALSELPGVEMKGYLDDLSPALESTEVFVVPLKAGSGIRVKILDAFAWGLPVVTSTVGFEGIDATHEEHLLVANETEEFSQAILRCLEDPGFAEEMSRLGRTLAESHYAWPVVDQTLDEALSATLQ